MTEPHLPDPVSPPVDVMAAERRRLILKGLGKGGAAMVALSPLVSQAASTHKIANSTLSGGFGYCTVSGFQSAAISGAPNTECSTFAPSHFVGTESLNYQALAITLPVTAAKLATGLNNKYFAGASVVDGLSAGTLLATPPTKLVVSGRNLVILPASTAGNGLALRLINPPTTDLADGTKLFSAVFITSTVTQTLLEVLYEAVVSNAPNSGRAYILSSYLTLASGAKPASLPMGFNADYVKSTYTNDSDFTSGQPRYNFYRALAVAA